MIRRRTLPTTTIVMLAAALPAAGRPEAFEIGPANTGDLPGGKEADGIIGDFVLRNDRVIAVISGDLPERRANMTVFYGPGSITPGCLYDLTFREDHNDQITYFGPGALRGNVTHVRITADGSDGKAVVRTYRSAAGNKGLEVTHDYVLEDGRQHVLVVSSYTNRGKTDVTIKPRPAWKGLAAEADAEGIVTGDAQDPYDRQGYAYGPVASGGTTESLDPFKLKPGETKRVAAALAVGRSPAEAYGVIAGLSGPTGTLSATVTEAGEGPPPVRAVLDVPVGGKRIAAYPDDAGRLSLKLPAGSYAVKARDIGRPDVTQAIEIKAGETTSVAFAMAPAAKVRVRTVGSDGKPMACKVQFNGIDGTKTPNLGPKIRAAGCDHQFHSANGTFTQQLPPGDYQIIVTRGIEFSHTEQKVHLEPGGTVDVTAKLRRVVDTRGWVSTDFHNHSTPSGDNYCGTDDRITNLAAEQIEFAPTTEHNRMYDWQPHIAKLGLSNEIATVVGIELTGGGPHLNSFPHVITPYAQDNGAPKWNADPRITALTLRFLKGAGPSRWVHLNHPLVGQYFRDRNKDGVTDGGFGRIEDYVDAAEVWSTEILNLSSGHMSGKRFVENRTFAWLQMLNQGRRMWCIAVSDAHAVFGNGVGGWRTYVPSSTDEPAKIDPKEIIRNAKAGRMIVTNGPFLVVEADDGTQPGGMTIAAGHIDLKVRVQCTTWVDVDKIVVLINGRPGKDLTFTRKKNADMFADGVVRFEKTIRVPLHEDAHLIVVATSETANLRTGYGGSWQSKMKPVAYSNPIFVDIDGNGWRPNGDTLGHPLLKTK